MVAADKANLERRTWNVELSFAWRDLCSTEFAGDRFILFAGFGYLLPLALRAFPFEMQNCSHDGC